MGSCSRFPEPPQDPQPPLATQAELHPGTTEVHYRQDLSHLKQIRRDLKLLQLFDCLNEKLHLLQEVASESWKLLHMDMCYYNYLSNARFFQWLPERIPFPCRRIMCRSSPCRPVRRCCTRSCWDSLL